MSRHEVVLERETANDDTATVVAIYVDSGSYVKKDEVLFDIENSKATQEVVAPDEGILTHSLTLGQDVQFGVAIAYVGPEVAVASAAPPAERRMQEEAASAPATVQRFSQAAKSLISQLGLDEAAFKADFVTTRDIMALSAPPSPPSIVVKENCRPPVAPIVATGGSPVTSRKRAEIDVLGKGAGATMLSVLGANLGTMTIARGTGDFLDGKIIDLVIYEASRLMLKYPLLNASYTDGQITLHDSVHAGLAIDSGAHLVVYGIEHADRLSLPELGEAIEDAVARYAAQELTGAELTRATFTVTDLSDYGLCFVLPLLPRGQSCILGITQDRQTGYQMFAGFDHRVTEGREVACFLAELVQRLQSFASATPAVVHECSYCGRSAIEAATKARDKGLLSLIDRNGRPVLCCASCWNGW